LLQERNLAERQSKTPFQRDHFQGCVEKWSLGRIEVQE